MPGRSLTSMCTVVLALSGAFATTASAQDPAPAEPAPAEQPAPGGTAPSGGQTTGAQSGGTEYGAEDSVAQPVVDGEVAKIKDGVAYAPSAAPDAVKAIIWAGNKIVGMPYVYGGGHQDFDDKGYDCSGTVSFALHGAELLRVPRDSSDFARFGSRGLGRWVTIYTNPGHAYMTVAGIRLDTSAADDRRGGKGPRWRPLRRSNRGYTRRHPTGL